MLPWKLNAHRTYATTNTKFQIILKKDLIICITINSLKIQRENVMNYE